jgi:hypothetical protein
VEVRCVVWLGGLEEHPDDDAVKAGEFGHDVKCYRKAMASIRETCNAPR